MPNITVYVPDALDARIGPDRLDLNLSGLFQAAVTHALDRRDALAAAQDDMTEQLVETLDSDHSPVRLRFTGKEVAGDGDDTVWLLHDGRVLHVSIPGHYIYDDADDFAEWVHDPTRDILERSVETVVRSAVLELGITPVIDL